MKISRKMNNKKEGCRDPETTIKKLLGSGKNYLRPLFISVLISLLSIACMQAKEPTTKKTLALDFKLPDLEQNTFTLSSYRDKQPVILLFWTTWCPFCRRELRELNHRYPVLAKEGWELLAINVGESSAEVKNFLRGYNLAFKVLLDRDTLVAQAYDILGVPTYVIIDKQGYSVSKDHYFPQEKYKGLISP